MKSRYKNLLKKTLYTISGVFVFLIILGILVPQTEKVPEVAVVGRTSQATSSNLNKETTRAINATTTPAATIRVAQPTEVKSAQVTKIDTPTATSSYTYYDVVKVVDGDTIKINIANNIETLRLIGIDTPETVDPRKPVQCFGKEASNKAKELLNGKKVRIEKDSTQGERDKYGRLLAYVYRDDELFYNKYMIEQGYAHEYTYNTPYKYQTEFKSAQKVAQTNQLGLWSTNTCSGDTTSGPKQQSISTTSATQANQSTGIYYASSHSSSQYYYPEVCSAWKSLSASYLRSFNSLNDLLAAYPTKTLSPQCQ